MEDEKTTNLGQRAGPPSESTAQVSSAGRPRVPFGRLTFGVLLVLLGGLWLLDAAEVVDPPWQLVLSAALAVVGLALMASARRETHGGLVGIGIVLTVLVLLSAAPDVAPLAGVGARDERPTTVGETEAGYELGLGTLTLDLRDVDAPEADEPIHANVGVGELIVRLPEDAGAQVHASAGIGRVVVLDQARGGVGVSLDEEVPGASRFVLDLSVGLGTVEVRR